MAELTTLESKLGEVLGLAMAAQDAVGKVMKLTENEELLERLEQVQDEARETEERCLELAGSREGKKTAITEKARETKRKAGEMMSAYLDPDADGLDGFEFLAMAEAGEVGHWGVLATMAEEAGERELVELAAWVRPIQERHLAEAIQGAVRLAAEKEPQAAA